MSALVTSSVTHAHRVNRVVRPLLPLHLHGPDPQGGQRDAGGDGDGGGIDGGGIVGQELKGDAGEAEPRAGSGGGGGRKDSREK